ncbi:MAG TPA: cyclic peptide export ABC transporter [Pyrinomonadaceae bacterium]|nr:cyclic peptide export ABC transporter [Pyrinomonadaceae bacterium]
MRLIRFLINHSPRMLVLAVIAGLAGGAASTAVLVVINAGLERSSSRSANLFLVFLGVAALGMVTRAGSALLLVSIGQSAMLQLRLRISRQILDVPLKRLEDVGMPRLLAILTDDILNLMNAIANLPVVCINVAAVVTCLLFLAWQSLSLFLIVMVLIVLLLFTAQIPFMIASGHFTLARKEHNTVMSHLRALISGIKELKVNRFRKREFVSELEESANRYRVHNIKAMRIAVLGATWAEMLTFVTIGLLVFVIPSFMTVPDSTLMNFVLIMLYLMEPIEFIQHQAPQFAKGSVALKSIEEIGLTLAKTEGEQNIERLLPPKLAWERLELDQLIFSYNMDDENRRFTLGPISFAVHPGELIFITGGNGSGKTTLAKLLAGLYSPESGQIRLDGKAVSDADREDYSQLFSAVFADFFVFEKLLGAEKTGLDEKAETYLRRLQLDHKVQVKEGLFSTTDLSQGQRKRLALLAAYLEDRPIFLFDEWAADQDPNFKSLFYQEILPELRARGKTVFVISHDQRYYDTADRVIQLDDGLMAETPRQEVVSSVAG